MFGALRRGGGGGGRGKEREGEKARADGDAVEGGAEQRVAPRAEATAIVQRFETGQRLKHAGYKAEALVVREVAAEGK